jgi:hypothetical protein
LILSVTKTVHISIFDMAPRTVNESLCYETLA